MSDEHDSGSGSADFNDEAKAETRRWLDRWRIVGPILDEERWARLSASSDAELRQQSWDLLALWRPGVAGDDGEGILLLQRHLARLRERDRT